MGKLGRILLFILLPPATVFALFLFVLFSPEIFAYLFTGFLVVVSYAVAAFILLFTPYGLIFLLLIGAYRVAIEEFYQSSR